MVGSRVAVLAAIVLVTACSGDKKGDGKTPSLSAKDSREAKRSDAGTLAVLPEDSGTREAATIDGGATSSRSMLVKADVGGMLTEEGAAVFVPPGALSTDTLITLRKVATTELPEGENLLAAYDVGPNGTKFKKWIEVRLPLSSSIPDGKRGTAVWLDGSTWVPLPLTLSATGVAARTTHLTVLGLMLRSTPMESGGGLTCASDVDCPANYLCQQKTCRPKDRVCGAAGQLCPIGQVCMNGVCAEPTVSLTITPMMHDFGSVAVGDWTGFATFTVTNSGPDSSEYVSITVISDGLEAPPFTVHDNACGPSLPAGGSCSFSVTFAPASTGLKTTELTATASSLGMASAELSGTGL